MNRRTFIQCSLASAVTTPLLAALQKQAFEAADQILSDATTAMVVNSAVIHVIHRDSPHSRAFGGAKSTDARFLLGSITKPICVAALMHHYDRGDFSLDDRLQKFLPQFTGDGREVVTLRHLLTHTSGLPDQLPENNELRKQHAGLSDFVARAIRARLSFTPGTKYQYSSMGILLATHVAELISKTGILELVDRHVFRPLKMTRSSLGLGTFKPMDLIPSQTEFAAPEAGAGDPSARDWDWNSSYWRKLGAPWGGAFCSAPDVGKFLAAFLRKQEGTLKPSTVQMMVTNQNPTGQTPRGLGFNVGTSAGPAGCSERTYGHTGSTGTLCWADPATETICVVLTSLPSTAVKPHPRDIAAAKIADAVRG
ncbi:MAG: serine hydrolase domain-containing protein [Planctomycetota bacterium]